MAYKKPADCLTSIKLKGKKELYLKEVNRGLFVLDMQTVFTERKRKLMAREPLVLRFLKRLRAYDPKEDKPKKSETDRIQQKIEEKWNVGIIPTYAAQPHIYSGDEVIEEPNSPLDPIKLKTINYKGKEVIEEVEPLIIIRDDLIYAA